MKASLNYFAKNCYGGPQISEDLLNEKSSEILQIYLKLEPAWIKTPDFIESIKEEIRSCISQVNSYSVIPYTYRIVEKIGKYIPKIYNNRFSRVKDLVREYAFKYIKSKAEELGYVLLNINLKTQRANILHDNGGDYEAFNDYLQELEMEPALYFIYHMNVNNMVEVI